METTARPEGSPGRDPAATYHDRAATFGAKREEQEHRHRVLASLRVVVFLASGPSRISTVAPSRRPEPCSLTVPVIAASTGATPVPERGAVLVPLVWSPFTTSVPS